MSKPIEKSVIERMVLAKRLFQQGSIACANQLDLFEFSKGLLSLQDAVELALGAIASVTRTKLKDPMAFAGYFGAINKELDQDKQLPYVRELSLLNKARVGVKHYGILQRPSDHAQAIGAVKPFLEYASSTFLERDFDNLSLADMIPDESIRNPIKDAERQLEKGTPESYRECVQRLAGAKYLLFDFEFDSAIAFPLGGNDSGSVSVVSLDDFIPVASFIKSYYVPSPPANLAFGDFSTSSHAQEIKMLQFGLDIHEFRKLSLILPRAHFNLGRGEWKFDWDYDGIEGYCHAGNWTPEFLRWAMEFVIDMAIKIKTAHPTAGLIPASEYFEYIIIPKKDEAVFFAKPGGQFVAIETGKTPRETENNPIVFRLPKGEKLVASIKRLLNGAWYEVHSSEIRGGKGYALAPDLSIERYPKKSESNK